MTKRKIIKITAIVAVSLFIVAAIIAMALFIPLNGEKNNEIWSYGQAFDINNIQSLEKKADSEFKILQLTDIQLWTNLGDNKKTCDMIKKLVDKSRPDLIVLTGDNVSGLTTNLLTRTLIKMMDGFKIPWAPVFGNHDAEGKATLNWIGDKFLQSEYCLFQKGPLNLYGVGNYALNIKEGNNIIQTLYLLDNGRHYTYPDGAKKEMYMGYVQIAWYKWNVENTKKVVGKVVPSMTFSHFAIPEFNTAIKNLCTKDTQDNRYYVPPYLGFGSCAYLPGVAPINSGFFEVAKELGSTHSMFFGHDHENDASIIYDGIRFTYGLKAGVSPRPWNNAKEYGGTMITIRNATENYAVTVNHIVQEQAK